METNTVIKSINKASFSLNGELLAIAMNTATVGKKEIHILDGNLFNSL